MHEYVTNIGSLYGSILEPRPVCRDKYSTFREKYSIQYTQQLTQEMQHR